MKIYDARGDFTSGLVHPSPVPVGNLQVVRQARKNMHLTGQMGPILLTVDQARQLTEEIMSLTIEEQHSLGCRIDLKNGLVSKALGAKIEIALP
jgi:hypothetical protein